MKHYLQSEKTIYISLVHKQKERNYEYRYMYNDLQQ